MKKILAISLALVIAILLTSCGSSNIHIPADAEEFIGRNYEDVVAELQDAGFTNVQTTATEDLTSAEILKDRTIEAISINDTDSFVANDEFSPDVKVLISYHTIKKVAAPLSSENIQDSTIKELSQSFVEAGFTNVSIAEEYDLGPDDTDTICKNEISINGVSTFSEGDTFPFDAEISVVCHYPYEKYTVKMHIDFVPNLLFSTYDVALFIDGEKQNTLEHGEDADFEFRLKEGEHTFTFANVESSSVKGEVALNVTCDVEVSYRIHCYSDKVEVDTVFVDFQNELAENETKMMCTESNFLGKDYHDVVTSLEELGFTNIKAMPEYDIYFGITQAESTASVTINGTNTFRRGDVFLKDSEIIISYHMLLEDNPENQTNSESPNSSLQPNTSVSYSTNDEETVKNGNSGVYSYKSTGGTYDSYWIIDFDEGYVYSFSEGNGNDICDRLKIESGNLNDVLIITYHDGDDTWSYGLHFKRKNRPSTLILQDNDGFEYTFI